MTKNLNRLKFRMGLVAVLCLWAACVYAKPAGLSQLLDEGVVRFYAEGAKPEQLPPSLALETEPKVLGSAPKSWTLVPDYTVAQDGRQTARIDIQPGTSLYGTGEVMGPLLRNGTVIECWNTDAYGYGPSSKSLYQSHPWVLAVRPDGSAFGVLADTTYRCRIDLTEDIEFAAEGPGYPVIIIDADSPQRVLQKLAKLIGKMPLPPRWSLGYQQCRYSYYPAARVLEVAKEFRSRSIPCDVIWMDIDYMNGYRIFTFDPNGFANPAGLNADLHKLGFKSIWMIDPGVKAQKGYFVYDQGTAGDCWVKRADGSEYNGEVWPGMCAFPDFTSPKTQKWWAGLYKDFMAVGVDGVWNDMCEPAVFNVSSKTMPTDNLHAGGDGLPKGTHAQYHNVYGMLMVKASRQGILAANPDKRPFVLVRANYIGGQRYAATWTGDNTASWEHLEYSVPMALNLGLSGQPFCGPDIGGFVGDGDGKLFARWMAVGALFPFSRGHTAKDTRNKEPWAFGKEVEDICRTALGRRYRLLPYLYTVFKDSSETGLPVMRPVFFADPDDSKLRAEDDAFLLGSDLLVIPKLSADGGGNCTEPQGIWRPISLAAGDDTKQADQPQLKIRGGAIIPLGRVVQNTTENSLDEMTLVICLDDKGTAAGLLYEDAGDGFGYVKGDYRLTHYTAKRQGNRVVVTMEKQGQMPALRRNVLIELITDKGVIKTAGREAQAIEIDM
jgi:alpha-glucosidase